ncbi:MAG: hypothetical protein HKN36_02090 [Hellea sp.]|nr:hypothetical protein [Hellea sp.]
MTQIINPVLHRYCAASDPLNGSDLNPVPNLHSPPQALLCGYFLTIFTPS